MKIGETIIDSLSVGPPDFGSRYVYTNWRNLNEGIYIVEVEIDPSYVESNMLNNAATRAIIVGDLESGAIAGQVTDPWGGVANIVIELYDSSGTTLLHTRNTTVPGTRYLIPTQKGTEGVRFPFGFCGCRDPILALKIKCMCSPCVPTTPQEPIFA